MATLVDSLGASEASLPSQQQQYDDDTPLFTCLSCSIAFPNPEDQRVHYRSDLHRYNMKRRVANLPPVRADVFNAKILERRAAIAQEQQDAAGLDRCDACDKKFASVNAYRAHLNAKKHKENVSKLEKKAAASATPVEQDSATKGDAPLVFRIPGRAEQSQAATVVSESSATQQASTADKSSRATFVVPENATEEQIQAAIDAKVAASRRINPSNECMFCPTARFTDLKSSLAHMSKVHGFFVPDSEYIVDLPGLVTYLADKVSIGNICLYCNGRGRGFHNLESVRKHMLDKNHCKLAYSSQEDQLELSDFYDFTSSYPDAEDDDEEWVEAEDDEGSEDMEVDDESKAAAVSAAATTQDGGDSIRYGDSELELVLPSGARLGHRSLRRYYQQTLWQTPASQAQEDEMSRRYGGGGALARRLIAESGMGHHDADGTLVPGRHGQVIKARNRGEAREAKRHINEFRDRNIKEQHRTRIGFINNSQKHFRDPLLQ